MRIKLTKLKEAPNPRHPNNIEEGFIGYGVFIKEPEVGKEFLLSHYNGDLWRGFHTSVVQEIIDDSTFRTCNSIYKWEKLEDTL